MEIRISRLIESMEWLGETHRQIEEYHRQRSMGRGITVISDMRSILGTPTHSRQRWRQW